MTHVTESLFPCDWIFVTRDVPCDLSIISRLYMKYPSQNKTKISSNNNQSSDPSASSGFIANASGLTANSFMMALAFTIATSNKYFGTYVRSTHIQWLLVLFNGCKYIKFIDEKLVRKLDYICKINIILHQMGVLMY